MKNTNQGEVLTGILLFLMLVGGTAFGLSKTKWFHGETRRAEASKAATSEVKTTVATVDESQKKRSAVAAASVAQIGEANTTAPDSKEKQFIAREVPVALANMETPDPEAMRASYERRLAVMAGQIDTVNRLYASALDKAAALQHERDAAIAARESAIAKRDAIDDKLSEVAAAHRAVEQQKMILIAVAGLLAALWIYTKLFSVDPVSLGRIAADIRAGESPIQALDTHLMPWLHPQVAKAAKLATPLPRS